ncbi:MAG: Stealth CR1 domain-containing protein, partial [Bacteroides sp.]|nr:Stealth CR1 domain-containing protein [Bacteroides sp.]
MDIDFVITWVDMNDPKWQTEFSRYSGNKDNTKNGVSEARFRDNGFLKYWFRGVEKFAPWVRKVHFVTCGHYPNWLNLNAPKLHFVKHSDYIPLKYLPTFNSHTIELNMHHIEGLSNRFVYFNDDFFLIDNVSPERFFHHGQPCDMAVLNAISTGDIAHILLNCIQNINLHFNKREVIKTAWHKWINVKYGKWNLRTMALMP